MFVLQPGQNRSFGPTGPISGIADELDSALNTDRKIENGKAIPAYWFPKGHVVQLATTGSEKAPGVRIVVGYRK